MREHDNYEANIVFGFYLVAMMVLAAIGWVSWDAGDFVGGTAFGAALLTAVWFTVKCARALARDSARMRP